MEATEWISNYRRYLKRRNSSPYTVKKYATSLGKFIAWLEEPVEAVMPRTVSHYIDFLMTRGLKPKTTNCHLQRIREFYHYLIQEEELPMVNPVRKGYSLRMPKPLPRQMAHKELDAMFGSIKAPGIGPCSCSCFAVACGSVRWQTSCQWRMKIPHPV